MRTHILAAMIAAVSIPVMAAPADAQSNRDVREYNRDVRDAQRDYNRDIRRADSRRDVRQAQREYRRDTRQAQRDLRRDTRDWRQYRNYDYNRYEQGQRGYYADNYYRDGRYYQTRRLGRNDRVYAGSNGRYYCRRSDGTTGLIVGGIGGGVLGNVLSNGRSATLGTLLGAGVGAVLGSAVDRGQVTCR